MVKIYEISEVRARQRKLAKLAELLGEQFHRVVIPPNNMLEEEKLDYILPRAIMRHIDDLTLDELDDLINGHLKFFILK